MTRSDDELEEFGKQTLAPLQSTPPLDIKAASEVKLKYMLEGEKLRQVINSKPERELNRPASIKRNILGMLQEKPVMKVLVAILLAIAVILAGSSITVFASQYSLPGQVLYQVKSWSEDVRLLMTTSPDAKLGLTLKFTNLRVKEISGILTDGNTVNNQTVDRFQQELEDAIQLAAQLDDNQMKYALGEIKSYAEKQGMTIQELISKLPPQADPAVLRLQERLNEQVQLSMVGEMNPKEFRVRVHERLQKGHGTKHSRGTGQSQSTPSGATNTQMPSQDDNNHGNDINQPTEVPGHSGPGNRNHGLKPTHTPKP
jgi:hypothetical protein